MLDIKELRDFYQYIFLNNESVYEYVENNKSSFYLLGQMEGHQYYYYHTMLAELLDKYKIRKNYV